MVELLVADAKAPLFLDTCYETDMAEGLKMMALEGRGIAFLPESAFCATRKASSSVMSAWSNWVT